MKKLQIGDEVSLRKGLTVGKKYGEITLLPPMSDLKQHSKILDIGGNDYLLRCELYSYWYSTEMFIFHKTKNHENYKIY